MRKTPLEIFTTKIDGVEFEFEAYYDNKHDEFVAEAFLLHKGLYCNTALSHKSIEDAILKLVKLIENAK